MLRGIYSYGFERLSRVQQQVLSPENHSKCKLVQWSAGSGKTIALIIRFLMKLYFDKPNHEHIQGLILVPTDYLAIQTFKTFVHIAEYIDDPRISMLVQENSETFNSSHRIIITTPQLALQNQIDVSNLVILAIDEMDLMLEFGTEHRKCIKSLFTQIPKDTEILCTGCRLPSPECYIHDQHLKDSTIICNGEELSEGIVEKFVYCPKTEQKVRVVKEYWNELNNCGFAIFCNTQNRAEKVNDLLTENTFPTLEVAPGWGNLTERFVTFRRTCHLIGTESDWYGMDVIWCSFVAHFDVVCDRSKSRLRSGRCGRFGRRGTSLYLPSNLEELDFVCEMLLGSASCKFQRVMLKELNYSDIIICSIDN